MHSSTPYLSPASPRILRAGFSILELLAVIAVSAVLLGVAIALIPREGFAVREVSRIMAADLTRARTEAIKLNSNVGITVKSTGYRVFLDTDKDGVPNKDYVSGDDAYNELDLNQDGKNDLASGVLASFDLGDQFGKVRLSGITITGGGDTLWFDVRGLPRGNTSASASAVFTISGLSDVSKQVQLGSQGRVLVVTP